MTCEHCCGATELFDLKGAKKSLNRYLKKGPRKPTRLLTDALKSLDLKGLSLLDIGGGIGAIQLELIPKGVHKVTNVDASEGYISIAKKEVEKRNYNDLINYHLGDFLDLRDQIELHDIVTLDKVICCYPFVTDLLEASLSKSNAYYALVFPQSNWASRIINSGQNLYLKLRGNPFRSFIHDPRLVENCIKKAGFTRIYSGTTLLTWQIDLYRKS